LHGYIEDHFFRPLPEFKSVADLNRGLEALAESYLDKRVSGESVRDRFERERQVLRPLPAVLFNDAECIRLRYAERFWLTSRCILRHQHCSGCHCAHQWVF
jgi:hypothetical protein